MNKAYQQFIKDYNKDYGYQDKEVAPSTVHQRKTDNIDGRKLRTKK